MKMDRLIGILSILLQQERITAPELAEQFEVSRRTIQRDIEALCRAGINKYPPAEPGVLHRRVKPWNTSGTRHVALVRPASREGLLLAARKRAV